MTIPSYTASGSFILFIPGLLFLLYGAWQAVRQRQNARRLILWGAVHDAGLICMALGAANAAAGAALGYRTFCPRSNSDWREEVRRILGAGV